MHEGPGQCQERNGDSRVVVTYTLACGFFLEKSQASPRSEILTCPCSSRSIFAGYTHREKKVDLQGL